MILGLDKATKAAFEEQAYSLKDAMVAAFDAWLATRQNDTVMAEAAMSGMTMFTGVLGSLIEDDSQKISALGSSILTLIANSGADVNSVLSVCAALEKTRAAIMDPANVAGHA